MKEIRLCDDGDLDSTFKLCIENNLGIEIQGFYNPLNIEKILTLAEKYTPNAIWNIECKVEFLQDSIDCLKRLNYL